MLSYSLALLTASALALVLAAVAHRLRRRPRPREQVRAPDGPPAADDPLAWHRRRAPRLARLAGDHRLLAHMRN